MESHPPKETDHSRSASSAALAIATASVTKPDASEDVILISKQEWEDARTKRLRADLLQELKLELEDRRFLQEGVDWLMRDTKEEIMQWEYDRAFAAGPWC